jgi:hypothetical protein
MDCAACVGLLRWRSEEEAMTREEVDEREGLELSNNASDESFSISVLSPEHVREFDLEWLGDVCRTMPMSSPEVSCPG